MPVIYCGKSGQYAAVVDYADFEYLSRWRWSFKRSSRKYDEHIYARRGGSIGHHKGGDKRHKTILMHIVICERAHGQAPSDTHTVDHRDNDTLNNRRNNLRWATKKEQTQNQRKKKPVQPLEVPF